MTVETEKHSIVHLGDNATLLYPYDFLIPSEEEMIVERVVIATGVVTVLSPDFDYLVTGIGDPDGGNVQLFAVVPVTAMLRIRRNVDFKQTVEINNQGGYHPEVLERQLDHFAFQTIQLKEQLGRTIRAPYGETLPDMPNRIARNVGGALAYLPGAPDTLMLLPFDVPTLTIGEMLESIAALRALDASNMRNTVFVASYYAGLGRGGGLFHKVGVGGVDDGGMSFLDAANNRWERILGPEGPDFTMFGAKGNAVLTGVFDGSVDGDDDFAAIQRAFEWVKSPTGNNNFRAKYLRAGHYAYKVSQTLDLTDMRDLSWVHIDFFGSLIISDADNQIVIDATGSRQYQISGLTGIGVFGHEPAVFIQVGRKKDNEACDSVSLVKCRTDGQFQYASMRNLASEKFSEIDCEWQNRFSSANTYAGAMDSSNYLQWRDRIAITSFTASNPTTVHAPGHQLAVGNRVKLSGLSGADFNNKMLEVLTVVDADRFTVGVDGTGVIADPDKDGMFLFEARFYSRYVEDTLEPWADNPPHSSLITKHHNCTYWAPRGRAGLLSTTGGLHYYDGCFSCAGIHDDPDTAAATITNITKAATAKMTLADASDIATGDLIWITGVVGMTQVNNKMFRAGPKVGNVIDLHDTNNVPLNTSGVGYSAYVSGGTAQLQINRGDGIHLIIGSIGLEGGTFDIHHEPGSLAHKTRHWMYVESMIGKKTGTPSPVTLKNIQQMHENAAHGIDSFIIIDANVSEMHVFGKIGVDRFTSDFGGGDRAGKLVTGATPFTLWGDMWLDNSNVFAPSATKKIHGTIYDMTAKTATRYRGMQAMLASVEEENDLAIASRVVIRDHFAGTLGNWIQLKGTDPQATISIVANAGGIVRVRTGDAGTGIAADGVFLCSALAFQPNRGGMMCEVKWSVNDPSLLNMFIGFMDQNTALVAPFELGAGDVLTSNAANAVGILRDTNADTDHLFLVGVAANVDATKQNLGVSPAPGVMETIKIEVNTVGTATFYRNGALVGVPLVGACAPAVPLCLSIGGFSRSAASRLIDGDYAVARLNGG